MKKIIIIEGPDNVGKTTLVNDLSKSLVDEVKIKHFGPPKAKSEDALQEQLVLLRKEMSWIYSGDGIEIWDRSVIGEAVYGPMYRTEQYDHRKYYEELEEACRKLTRQIFVIVLFADLDWYKQMKIKPKRDEVNKYQMMTEAENIAVRFVNVITHLPLKHRLLVNCQNYPSLDVRNIYVQNRVRGWLKGKPFVHTKSDSFRYTFFNTYQRLWDSKKGFTRDIISCGMFNEGTCKIGRDHRRICEYGKSEHAPTEGCGTIRPKYIFVGEAPGTNGCGKLGIPFYNDPSGNLLQDALEHASILPTEYYMTNVVKCTPFENKLANYVDNDSRKNLECVDELRAELHRAGYDKFNDHQKVIAIGRVASYELKRLKIEHDIINHPAYYLRMGQRTQFLRDFKKLVKGQ